MSVDNEESLALTAWCPVAVRCAYSRAVEKVFRKSDVDHDNLANSAIASPHTGSQKMRLDPRVIAKPYVDRPGQSLAIDERDCLVGVCCPICRLVYPKVEVVCGRLQHEEKDTRNPMLHKMSLERGGSEIRIPE
jgi:hypothetical protein